MCQVQRHGCHGGRQRLRHAVHYCVIKAPKLHRVYVAIYVNVITVQDQGPQWLNKARVTMLPLTQQCRIYAWTHWIQC